MESAIWDDSALIRAFDDAMTKYKVMHGLQKNSPDSANKVDNNAQGGEISAVDQSRNMEFHHDADNLLKSSTETPAICDTSGAAVEIPALDASNLASDSNIENSCTYASIDPASRGQFDGYVTPEYADYNQLISKYNELEMQRQQVLQQIYQPRYSNYQPSSNSCVSSPMWDVCCCTVQAHHLPMYQTASPCLQSLCHPCYCVPAQPLRTLSPEALCCATNSSIPATVPDSASGTANQPSSSHDNAVLLGMEAAERALASIKIKAFESNKPREGEQGGNLNSRSDTQISDLLTAWYSAGFYTGKGNPNLQFGMEELEHPLWGLGNKSFSRFLCAWSGTISLLNSILDGERARGRIWFGSGRDELRCLKKFEAKKVGQRFDLFGRVTSWFAASSSR